MGETLRRLAGKLLIARYQPEAAGRLTPEQVGVGVPRGAENLVHRVRMWLQQAAPDHVLLQLDFRNAFNSVKRKVLLQAIADSCPWFLPYALACYSHVGTLFADGGFTIDIAEGVHQGDPCGPLFFALAIMALSKSLGAISGCWSQWYLDDGYLVGPRALLHDLLPGLEAEAAKLGLQLNRGKCAVLVPASDLGVPEHFFPGVPRVTSAACLPVLGSPVGEPSACLQWVQDRVSKPLELALQRLLSLGEPRSASLVLRQCFSACKVNWILRTAEPAVGRALAVSTEPQIRQSWDGILGTVCSDLSWSLSTLPIRLGGAGIASPLPVCDAAVVSSWIGAVFASPGGPTAAIPVGFEAAVSQLAVDAPALGRPLLVALQSSGVSGLRDHSLRSRWSDQSAWAEEVFRLRAESFDSAANVRLQGLRAAQECAGAGLWLTATPGAVHFAASEWQLLLRFRVGAACYSPGANCAGCRQPMDPGGDHALSCASNGTYRRHNHLRDCLFSLSQLAGWCPELEQSIPGTRCRPADLLLRSAASRPLAVDVTVSHPLRSSAPSAVREGRSSAAGEAERTKVAQSKGACQAAGWDFCPFGVDSTGGLGPSARQLCRRLAKALAMRAGADTATLSENVGTRISLALAKGRGEMLCAATPLPTSSLPF